MSHSISNGHSRNIIQGLWRRETEKKKGHYLKLIRAWPYDRQRYLLIVFHESRITPKIWLNFGTPILENYEGHFWNETLQFLFKGLKNKWISSKKWCERRERNSPNFPLQFPQFSSLFYCVLAALPGTNGALWAASRRGVRFVLIMEFLDLKKMYLWKYSVPHLQFAGSSKGGAACDEMKN